MIAHEWTGLVLGLVLAAVLAALARFGLRGDPYRCTQGCRFGCPRSGDEVECVLDQDLRTGQWTEIRSCSLFHPAEDITCDRDCVRRLNLGFRLASWQQKALGLRRVGLNA